MSEATLEATVSAVLQSELITNTVEFLWHAGEPLTAGLPFYKKAVSLIEIHNSRGIIVENSIQTNGILINEHWCDFFLKNKFSIGLSIDGPAFLHDRNRVTWSGHPSHREVMRKCTLLRESGIRPSAICVLTRNSLAYPDQIFAFFLENDFHNIGFNLEEVENANAFSSFTADVMSSAIVEEYRSFISRLYDLWLPHAGKIVIREFHDMFAVLSELLQNDDYHREPLETVAMGIVSVQKNGDITTFSPEFAGAHSNEFNNFVIGNIMTDRLRDVVSNPLFAQIRDEVEEGVRRCADSCAYFAVCGGAFTSNKYFETGSLSSTQTNTCLLHRQTLTSVLLEKLTPRNKSRFEKFSAVTCSL